MIQHINSEASGRWYRRADLVQFPITLLNCALAAAVARIGFSLNYSLAAVGITALVIAPAFVLLSPAFRSRVAGALFGLAVCLLLFVGHALKIATLRSPINAADLQTVTLLLEVLSGRYLVWALLLLAATIALVFGCFRLRPRSLPPVLFGLAYATILVLGSGWWIGRAEHWLNGADAGAVPTRAHNFDPSSRSHEQIQHLQSSGGLLYLLDDWQNMRRDVGYIPTREEIAALSPQAWRRPAATQRNIHIVLLESMWDASVLDGMQGSAFDPRFQAMWDAAGKPHALSPVIGGMTANAEFEVLCGLAAPSTAIAFLDNLTNEAPCLPAVLQSLGYLTLASHPHEEGNWNRAQAYGRLGFAEFRPINSFELDDMDGPFLADGSLFRQNQAVLGTSTGRPTFNYVVSLSSHWAYARDRTRRPDKFTIPELTLLPDYLNASFYTTAAAMDWAESILEKDPDALIVMFGDHAPVLDSRPDVYQRLNGKVYGEFESDALRRQIGMSRVPLLVIDGERGPVPVADDTPLFALPALLGDLLGTGPLLPYARPASDIVLRPMLGQLLAKADGRWLSCGTRASPVTTPTCERAWALQTETRLVRQDIVAGHQFYLDMANARAHLHDPVQMKIARDHLDCEYEITQWGPSEAQVGQPFNAGADGRSAVWISFGKLRGAPEVEVGGVAASEVRGQGLITASVPTAEVTGHAGKLPITLRCPGESATTVGEIEVR